MLQALANRSSTNTRFRRQPWVVDGVLGASLFVASVAIAAWYVPRFSISGGKPWFYQYQFGPAVMTACGHGYINPPTGAVPALDGFLRQTRDSISCSEVSGAPAAPLTSMQRAFRYLIATVGWTWRLEGRVAWSALTPLYAALYGVTVLLAYAIFRHGMGPVAAGLCAGALAVSTLHLNNLPHLRDYAKAPFVLALALIATRLVIPPVTTGRTPRLAAIAGLVTGIGIGFRNDLLVAIPAFVGLLALFLPVRLSDRIGLRLSAIATYAAAVYIAMAPMRSIYTIGGGNSTPHLVLLGLTRAFSDDLGVDNSRLYEWGFEYRDELALATIDNYADRRLGDHRFLPMYSEDYDRAGTRYLIDIVRNFPADMLARVYASVFRLMELPYSARTSALITPPFAQDPFHAFDARTWLLRKLTPIWPWAFALTFLLLSLASVRLGLFAALFILYVAGYPALQFQERHFFHLEFIGWGALGFAASFIGHALAASFSRERRAAYLSAIRPADGWGRPAGRAIALWSVLAVAIVVPIWALRHYQQDRVRHLLRTVASAPRENLAAMQVPAANGRVRFETPSLSRQFPSDEGVHAAYLVAELGGPRCDALKIDVIERYAASQPQYDFTHTVSVPTPLSDDPLQLFFPAYFHNPESTDPAREGFAFTGVELPGSAAGCLSRLSRVSDSSQVPVLLDLQLPPDWERVTPYATIAGVEARTNPQEVYAHPPDLPRSVVRRSLMADPLPFQPADISKKSPTFRMLDREWRVAGVGGVGGRGPLLYLVEMKPRHLNKNSFIVAEGTIEKGGVTFGLVRRDQWAVQLHVTQTGPFAVVIRVPENDEYKVILANNLRGMSLDNRLVVTRVGVIAGPDGDEK